MADLMTLNKQLMEQFGLGSDTSKTKEMIMGMWSILEEGRDDYGRGFGMRDGGEIEEA